MASSHSPNLSNLVWLSERQAINPATIALVFRGTHGEIEITFSAGEKLTLHENNLSAAGKALLLPTRDESVHVTGPALVEGNGLLTRG